MKQKKQRLNLADFRATDREECGILVGKIEQGNRVAQRIVPVPNVAQGDDDYAISMKSYRRVERSLNTDEVIVGFFHTHLPHHDIGPSDNDFVGASVFPEMLNLVYKPSTGEQIWYIAPRLEAFED